MPNNLADNDIVLVRQDLAQLTDLFKRRLLNDKVQSQALSLLREELDNRRGELGALCREVILLLDRAQKFPDDESVQSFADELLEILSHYGMEKVDRSGTFDPKTMKVISTEPRDEIPKGEVIRITREGYLLNGTVLRPQEVVVSDGSEEPKD